MTESTFQLETIPNNSITPTINSTEPRRISNSESSSWLACQRRYYYEYDLGVTPVSYSEALNRGILGHEVLAVYYQAILDGIAVSGAKQVALQIISRELANGGDLTILLELKELIELYWELQDDSDWEIVAVERKVEVPMTERFEYALRFDMLVRIKSTGKFQLIDHKFVYDFWSYDDVQLSPQFPKYVAALNSKGIEIEKCVLNQLRYRKIKVPTLEMKFARIEQVISKAKKINAMADHIKVSDRIMTHRELPTIEAKSDDAVRSLNKQTCKYCQVKPLCMAEFDGAEIHYLLENEYTTENSYGYNKTEVSELL